MATYNREILTRFYSTDFAVRPDPAMHIYVPPVNITAGFPVVIFCHGAGENSKSSTDTDAAQFTQLETELYNNPSTAKYFHDGADENVICLTPQLPIYQQTWPTQFMEEAIAHAKTLIPEIDDTKIIVMGWSQGGRGVYGMLKERPNKVKGAVPLAGVSGGIIGNSTDANTAMSGGARVWFMHNADDGTVAPGSSDSVYNLLEPIDSTRVHYTRFTSGGHNVVDKVLNGSGGPRTGGDRDYPDGGYTIWDFAIDAYAGTGGGGGDPDPPTDGLPTITLNGANPINLNVGDTYTEPGATASDPEDGALTVTISGTVDTNTPGTYTITYSATSSTSQTVQETRTVNVTEEEPLPGGYQNALATFDNFINAESSTAGQLNETVSGNTNSENDGANFYPVYAGRDFHVTWPLGTLDKTYNIDFHKQKGDLTVEGAIFGISVRNAGAFRIENGVLTYAGSLSGSTHARVSIVAAENNGLPVLKKSSDGTTFTTIYNFTINPLTPLVGAVRFKENTASVNNLTVYYDPSDEITPTLLKPLPDTSAVETVGLVYTIPSDTFVYLNGVSADLNLSASGLPAWAAFTDNGDGSGTITGTPPTGAAGQTATVTITATAPDNTTKSDTLELTTYEASVLDLVGFTASNQTPQAGGAVTFTPLKTAGFTRFHWELPGSNYPEADGNEPIVTYSTPGEYTVTMWAVVDSNTSIKIVKPWDYITVFPNLTNPNHYIDIPAGTRVTPDGVAMGVQPGDVVCLRNTGSGTPGSAFLTNFVGTVADPIWFTNPSGVQVEIAYNGVDGLKWEHCRHIREAFVNDIKYGLYIESVASAGGGPQGHAIIGNSYNHRTYGVEQGRHGFAGFMAKNDPNMYSGAYNRNTGYTMWGRWLKHCKINSNGNRLSGFGHSGHEHVYFGHFKLEEAEGPSHYMPDCQIAYNEFVDAGRDNIQVGCVGPSEDCQIYHNTCNGAGLEAIGSHMQNLALNEGFGGVVFGNVCSGAAEQFMDLHPYGSTYIFNNIFHGHGYIRVEDSSFAGTTDSLGTVKPVDCNLYFFNNTAVNCQSGGSVEGVLLRTFSGLGDPFINLLVENNAYTYLNSGREISNLFDGRTHGTQNVGRAINVSGEMGFVNHDNNQRLLPGSILRSGGADLSSNILPFSVARADADGYPYPGASGIWFIGAHFDTQQVNAGSVPVSEEPTDPGTGGPEINGIKTAFFGLVGRF